MKTLLSTYFEIEDIIDISINVQKSIIKQRDRRQKFLADSSNLDIAIEAAKQFKDQFTSQVLPLSSYCPLSSYLMTGKKNSTATQTPLFLNGADKYEMLQGRAHGGHSYLIYVLKHREGSQINAN